MGRLLATVIAAVAVLAAVLATAPAFAQQGEGIRVIARKLDTGVVELGVRQDGRDTLPEYRFFDYVAEPVGEWLETSPVSVRAPWGAAEVVVIVRRAPAGRVEVGLDTYDVNFDIWIEGAQSFGHATAVAGRWLRSGPAVLTSYHNEEMPPVANAEPTHESAPTPEPEPTAGLWPPPVPTYPAPWPPAASAFWPEGTCALGPHHDPGGDILFCTPPAATDLRSYLDAFVGMVSPWYPWIGATLEWTGGYSVVADVPSGCKPHGAGEFVTACYGRGSVEIFLGEQALLRTPVAFWGETLIHELAHAFDHARWSAQSTRPSMQLLTWYDESARIEVFAEAMAVNTIGESAHLPRYTGRDGIPGRPTVSDILAAGEAVIEWCPIKTCGVPRLATEVVWAPVSSPRPQQSASSTATQTAAEIMHAVAKERERALALAQALAWCSTRSYTVRFNVPTTDPVTGDLRTLEEVWAERERLRREWIRECQDEARREHEATQ